MFASLLRSKTRRPSETTPLLAALDRYRNRRNGVEEAQEDDAEGMNQDEGDEEEDEEEEEDEDEDRQRDGPLLPVFSSTFLGMSLRYSMIAVLTDNAQIVFQSTAPPTPSASYSSNDARPRSLGINCARRRFRNF
jgi:hypothetical protein